MTFVRFPAVLGVLVLCGTTLAQVEVTEPVNEYTVGTAYPSVYNTYEMQPQIQIHPAEPYPRIVPKHKTPVPLSEQKEFRPKSIKRYGGFDGTEQTPWSPPDPTLAVGPDHIMETVNMNVAWYTRDGELEFSQRLDSTGNPGFFDPVGAGDFTFDPKCVYDHHSERFFIIALEFYTNESWITIAISDDSDPNGVWFQYRTDAVTAVGGSTFWVDYPGWGYDDTAFYVTGNLFPLSGGGFAGVKYRIFDKAPLLTGSPAVFFDLRDGSSASAQVATVANTSTSPYFVSVADSTTIRIQSITDPVSTPVLQTADVDVSSFSSPGSAPNLGGSSIDTLDGRIINSYYRDGFLYAGHGIDGPSNSIARWYEFETNNWPDSGTPSLSQEGEVSFGSGDWAWFPALARNAAGVVRMVFARSSSADFASIWYTQRESGDAPGTMQAARMLKDGASGYNNFRWGDYFDVAVDPRNDETIWGIGEYAGASTSWRTWIGILGFTDGAANNIGAGCAGSGGFVPTLTANAPVLGEDLNLDINDSIGGAKFWYVFGLAPDSFTFLGCDMHVATPWILLGPLTMQGAAVDGAGFFNQTIGLDYDTLLIGESLLLQALILDPGAPFGLAATNGVELVFGDT